MRNLGFGAGCGAVSALMFSIVATGSPLSLVLYAAAPLPILIAALGFTHQAGLVAAVTAMLAVLLIFSPVASLAYGIAIGIPAWGLGLAVNLAREHEGKIEWYPLGKILGWIIGLSAFLTLVGSLALAADYPSFIAAFDEFADAIESVDPSLFAGMDAVQRADAISALSKLMALIAPPISAAISVVSFVVLIYLAARIVKTSSRLPRPWPDLARVALPRSAVIALALSIIGSVFLPDYAGLLSRITLAALTMGFCIQGLAFVHLISRPLKSRRPMLGMLYFTFLALPGWPVLGFALVGVADAWFSLKKRRIAGAPSNFINPNLDA
jgi:hypothetical protein